MLSKLFRASPLLLGLSPFALLAAPAPLEEIVVTGALQPRTLEELPTAVTVFTQADLEARGQSHLEGLLAESPNVNAANGGGRARFFQMRGIGERGQFSEPLNPSVGLILDGVDLSGAGGAAQLFDLDAVNLFRGPQPGRYGANALAGL
ncbi:MAG: TonB-dependent receptor plug domain-containing protein, partial [Pseudomonadales bacterium]